MFKEKQKKPDSIASGSGSGSLHPDPHSFIATLRYNNNREVIGTVSDRIRRLFKQLQHQVADNE